jgi:hypothetical protein
MKSLILNRRANEYGRAGGVSALAPLAGWAEVPRDSIVDYLLWLAREGLEREPSQVWGCLANECVDINKGVLCRTRLTGASRPGALPA